MLHKPRTRRGISLVYCTAMLVVLIGFASLAVDIGRVQVAHTEARTAADAAALAAATTLRTDLNAARSRALEIAEENTCDNTPVDLDPDQDVDLGRWHWYTKTFEE